MGTRADFYIGRGENAEWLGSIAFDGYPDGLTDIPFLLTATSEPVFRKAVEVMLDNRRDGTKPEDGWPWPWVTSHTTDYAYALDEGKVWASSYGSRWFDPMEPEQDDEDEPTDKVAIFPDMTERKNVTYGRRSGLIII